MAVSVLELERIASRGWRGLRTEHLGEWLLRESGGFTQRGNSCLPLGDPGRSVDEAVDAVQAWYAARGQLAMMQLPFPVTRDLDQRLAGAGWERGDQVVVMTAGVDDVLRRTEHAAADEGLLTSVDPRPSSGWLAGYHYRGGGPVPEHGVDVLTNGDVLGFASVRAPSTNGGDDTVAIARGSVDDGWLGIFAVEVDERVRGRGLGTTVLRALLEWGRRHGAQDAYLQVAEENAVALRLYARQGFVEHHRYGYRRRTTEEVR